jgi:hypothetical protein
MNEGMIALAIRNISGTFPPSQRTTMARVPKGSSSIEIACSTHGNIEVTVREKTDIVVAFESAPISLTGTGHLVVTFSWSQHLRELRLSQTDIPSAEQHRGPPIPIVLSMREVPQEYSIGHPQAVSACAPWIEWRADRFSAPARPSAVQRVKSYEEQLDDLRSATLALGDLLDLCARGRRHHVDHLAASLRALVYSDSGKKKFHPLLLRMAARQQPPLPLPVFAFPEGPDHAPPGSPVLAISLGTVTLERITAGQRLMDLQEWLDTLVRVEAGDEPLPPLPAREVILRTASESGAAHYSELTFLPADDLNQTSGFGRSTLDDFIIHTSKVVFELAVYVLRNAGVDLRDQKAGS